MVRKSSVTRNAARRGFTLIELLAVMLIIGVLMGMIVGIIAYAHRANLEARAKADIEKIRTALADYRMDEGVYPAEAGWTNALRPRVPLDVDFIDPWGNVYRYFYDGSATFRLYSLGEDGEESPPPEADADNIVAGRY